jgi:hypothetical protein
MVNVFDTIESVAQRVIGLRREVGSDAPSVFRALGDVELEGSVRTLAELRHQIDLLTAFAAGELQHRSRRERGYAGLAQSKGHVNAQKFMQALTGTSATEAVRFVKLGAMLNEATASAAEASAERAPLVDPETGEVLVDPDADERRVDAAVPWHETISAAVLAGQLSAAAGTALREGLGEVTEDCPDNALREAAERMLPLAGGVTPERAWKTGRLERDLIDPAGVADREKSLRERRSLKLWKDRDDLVHLHGILDPEPGDELLQAINQALGPRIGGPRFVEPTAVAAASSLLEDARSNEQIAADAFITIMKAGLDADPTQLPGGNRATVRVIIPVTELENAHGTGWIDGTTTAVPATTVNRLVCNTGITPIVIDTSGAPLDLGRDQRLFTKKQRTAMSIRDGGCRWPDCNKPPSMCEAHHINQWQRDGGRTDIADGILLCRHHHMLTHDNGWEIERVPGLAPAEPDEYRLIPPVGIDPEQSPIPMPSKSPISQYYARQHSAATG